MSSDPRRGNLADGAAQSRRTVRVDGTHQGAELYQLIGIPHHSETSSSVECAVVLHYLNTQRPLLTRWDHANLSQVRLEQGSLTFDIVPRMHFAIAIYLYIFLVKSNRRLADSWVLCFHVVSWGIPLGITIAAVALGRIGYDASEVSVGWCWVSIQAPDHVLWILLTGKIWEILAYLILPILYILIKKHIHRAHEALSEYRPILARNPNSQSPSSMADMKLIFIPVIFISLRIWSTIRFMLMLVDNPARQNPVLVTLHGIGNTFQGAANCIMFVFLTRPIRSRLLALLCFCCYPSRAAAGQGHAPSKPGPGAETTFLAEDAPSGPNEGLLTR
ncbi:hypothetical protein DPEC_G00015750 [Dallia pectoralis]|uniref:Uncharacterized protein n=1 Tax=Dallia pectoralis TaxID=75939 RepID=A0ACC2HNG4_DALPE|nr:hypothetical protein DPEC_G00015750 [Dallia pectoralis]